MTCIRVITYNQMTESILGCFEISPIKEIIPALNNFALGKFLGEQKNQTLRKITFFFPLFLLFRIGPL